MTKRVKEVMHQTLLVLAEARQQQSPPNMPHPSGIVKKQYDADFEFPKIDNNEANYYPESSHTGEGPPRFTNNNSPSSTKTLGNQQHTGTLTDNNSPPVTLESSTTLKSDQQSVSPSVHNGPFTDTEMENEGCPSPPDKPQNSSDVNSPPSPEGTLMCPCEPDPPTIQTSSDILPLLGTDLGNSCLNPAEESSCAHENIEPIANTILVQAAISRTELENHATNDPPPVKDPENSQGKLSKVPPPTVHISALIDEIKMFHSIEEITSGLGLSNELTPTPNPDPLGERIPKPNPDPPEERIPTPDPDPPEERIPTPDPDPPGERIPTPDPDPTGERIPTPDPDPPEERIPTPNPDPPGEHIPTPDPDPPGERIPTPDSDPPGECIPTPDPDPPGERIPTPDLDPPEERIPTPHPDPPGERIPTPDPDPPEERIPTPDPDPPGERIPTPDPDPTGERIPTPDPDPPEEHIPTPGPDPPGPDPPGERAPASGPGPPTDHAPTPADSPGRNPSFDDLIQDFPIEGVEYPIEDGHIDLLPVEDGHIDLLPLTCSEWGEEDPANIKY